MDQSDKIYNSTERRKFLETSDIVSLNKYLKQMEKLSKKNDKYKKIYDEDIMFLSEQTFTDYQNKCSVYYMMTGKRINGDNFPATESEICNTEAIIDKVNNVVSQVISKKDLVECDTPKNDLNFILGALTNRNMETNDWVKSIRKFVDNVVFSPNDSEIYKKIMKAIASDPQFIAEAFDYLSGVIKNNKQKISMRLINGYTALRNKKKTLPKIEYTKMKNNMFSQSANANFSIAFVSRFVEKIAYLFNKCKK